MGVSAFLLSRLWPPTTGDLSYLTGSFPASCEGARHLRLRVYVASSLTECVLRMTRGPQSKAIPFTLQQRGSSTGAGRRVAEGTAGSCDCRLGRRSGIGSHRQSHKSYDGYDQEGV